MTARWDPALARKYAEDMAEDMTDWANDMSATIERLNRIEDRDCESPEVYLAYWRGAAGVSLPDDCTSEIWEAIREGDRKLYEELRAEGRDLVAAMERRDQSAMAAVQERMERRRTESG